MVVLNASMKNISFLIASLFLFVSCTAQQGAKDLLHLQYGDAKQNTLDLFLPDLYTAETPVIIMLHGGGWMMGGNEYTDKTSKDLRNRGFIVANVDYRYVSKEVSAKDVLQDIASAIKQVQELSATYNYSAKGYHLAGISAGAHLSLLYGYTGGADIKSITALCAPSRLDEPAGLAALRNFDLLKNVEFLAGATFKDGTAPDKKFTAISPYAHIKNIPTLLFHGDADNVVPYSQSVFMYGKLQEKKVTSKFITIKGKGHDCGMNDADSEKLVLDEITNWVKQHN